jgi:SAM-dependent methyltransferase
MRCRVCGGKCDKDVVQGIYSYWKCTNCFTAQLLPQPNDDKLREYYDLFHLPDDAGGVYDEVEARMQADFPAKVDMALKYGHSEHPRLLDVGCGKGFFIKAAEDRGIRAEGIDVSQSGVTYARDVLGVKAKVGRIEEQEDVWRDAFDVVTLWATIEHLADPASVLRAIHHCLKPGGTLLCDTGLGHVFSEMFLPGHSQWYDAPQHLFVFSERGLSTLMEASGFRVVRADANFDRTLFRRWIRLCRHTALCFVGFLAISPLLGKRGLIKMRQESKWPIGRLLSVVAQKRESSVVR